ncbi:MAG: hypothetical protein KDA63_06695 [Planctomycetales bacterium]|nr:hypothetical protein [Planctomycetales bacterium]
MTPMHPLLDLIRRDQRYRLEAYLFVDEALAYAQQLLDTGQSVYGDPLAPEPEDLTAIEREAAAEQTESPEPVAEHERHLTGQELCEAIRRYSLDQYGLMAKVVFNNWGVTSTSDFGEIVFNMIDIGRMKKTESDRREDFDDVFDFDKDLVGRFKIELPSKSA